MAVLSHYTQCQVVRGMAYAGLTVLFLYLYKPPYLYIPQGVILTGVELDKYVLSSTHGFFLNDGLEVYRFFPKCTGYISYAPFPLSTPPPPRANYY